MTDNAQQGNNQSSSAQGAPKPTGDKPQGTEAGKPATRAAADRGAVGSTARAALFGDHPQRSSAVREAARDQRGAGTGENANATRMRNIVSWPPEPLSHAEHVEELLEIAQEHEDYNAAVNEEQIAVVRDAAARIGSAAYPLGDPELERQNREESLETYRRDNDPKMRLERVKGEMLARAARHVKRVSDMYGEDSDAATRTEAAKDALTSRLKGAKERVTDKVAGAAK